MPTKNVEPNKYQVRGSGISIDDAQNIYRTNLDKLAHTLNSTPDALQIQTQVFEVTYHIKPGLRALPGRRTISIKANTHEELSDLIDKRKIDSNRYDALYQTLGEVTLTQAQQQAVKKKPGERPTAGLEGLASTSMDSHFGAYLGSPHNLGNRRY